jgi:decaprenyl-phosphate phosphoribosyltransferase
MRVDHWIKNVFVLPGILVALTVAPARASAAFIQVVLLGFLAIGLVASSNYVINEVLDAPYDVEHPIKRLRPVPSGLVDVRVASLQWILLMVAGVGLAFVVSRPFAITLFVLWVMGTMYNLEPIRSKDIPYVDVLSEALNNPLRMLAGWFIVGLPASRIPVSLILSYWMIGCYFMGIKRYAEFRHMRYLIQMERYRPAFAFYSESRLLASIMFYASAAMLFLGAFIMRYRMELILSFPLVAAVMAIYLMLAFKPDSAVQAPEKLYREPVLVLGRALRHHDGLTTLRGHPGSLQPLSAHLADAASLNSMFIAHAPPAEVVGLGSVPSSRIGGSGDLGRSLKRSLRRGSFKPIAASWLRDLEALKNPGEKCPTPRLVCSPCRSPGSYTERLVPPIAEWKNSTIGSVITSGSAGPWRQPTSIRPRGRTGWTAYLRCTNR